MSKQSRNGTAFLIDEDLTHELADLAYARGFAALAINRLPRLRGRSDHIVAKYALEHEYVLVTNNIVDFERIYQEREMHPGLVFIAGPSKLRTKRFQLLMMVQVLDEIEQRPLVQEALHVSPVREKGGDVLIYLNRYFLPELAASTASAFCA